MSIDLRIRFCGLCLFVRAADGSRVDVLLPRTVGSGVPEHTPRLCWRSPGAPLEMEEAEVHNVVATLAATGKYPTLAADGLFGMEEWPAAGPCAPGKPKPVPDAPWTTLLSLYAGSAETVNAGARWQLPNGRQAAMATVVDWRIEVDAFSDLHATWEGRNAARMRSVWPGLKDTVQPDGAGQPTIDLWMLHLPHRLEALEISSKPASNHHVRRPLSRLPRPDALSGARPSGSPGGSKTSVTPEPPTALNRIGAC